MRVRRQNTQSELVIWVTCSLMLLGMLVLVSALWKLQVKGYRGFESRFTQQTVRRVRLPAIRGKIYDAKEVCLADNVPNYCIAIYTEELRSPRSPEANTLELLHKISAKMGLRLAVSYRDVCQHLKYAPNQPLVAWQHLTPEQMTRWREVFYLLHKDKTRGLPDKVEGHSIQIFTKDLLNRPTSTAANTLELVYQISERIGLPPEVSYRDIVDHIYARRPLPLMAWWNINEQTMARWADACSGLVGADIFCRAARTYPLGDEFAHLLGFTLDADAVKQEGSQRVDFDLRGIKGSKGLESRYERLLEGDPGMRLVQIDVSGYRHRDLQTKPPKAGGDLLLTVDAQIQRIAQDALTMHVDGDPFEGPVRGACVVLDPNNGDVLAMVSSPAFDPNRYMQEGRYRMALQTDPLSRMYDRAVFGAYAPGSTFKPVATLGTLRAYPEYAKVHHDCPGYHMIGKRKMRCNSTHGDHLSIRQALEHSCNVYMYKMVLECGYEPIYEIAREFGLGQYAGLFPDLEMPNDPEKERLKYGNLPETALNDTDSCNLSIGQGALQVAPLQMAMVAATIANGGILYRPRLVQKFRAAPDRAYQTNPTWTIRRMDIPAEALAIVRGGMHDVIMSGNENAKQVQVGDVVIAGKTGTAEYGKNPDGTSKKNTWMISYAPFDHPRYAIAMIVEDGIYGGTTVAPRLHKLYAKLFEYDGTIKKEDA